MEASDPFRLGRYLGWHHLQSPVCLVVVGTPSIERIFTIPDALSASSPAYLLQNRVALSILCERAAR